MYNRIICTVVKQVFLEMGKGQIDRWNYNTWQMTFCNFHHSRELHRSVTMGSCLNTASAPSLWLPYRLPNSVIQWQKKFTQRTETTENFPRHRLQLEHTGAAHNDHQHGRPQIFSREGKFIGVDRIFFGGGLFSSKKSTTFFSRHPQNTGQNSKRTTEPLQPSEKIVKIMH